jgi:hypothetical protein
MELTDIEGMVDLGWLESIMLAAAPTDYRRFLPPIAILTITQNFSSFSPSYEGQVV